MLNVISLAYRDLPPGTMADQISKNVESRRTHLFECYVKRMFERLGKARDVYPWERTKSWLTWLARAMRQHSITVFLVEHLQPSWLAIPSQRWKYAISSRVFIGLSWTILSWILSLALQPVFRESVLSGMRLRCHWRHRRDPSWRHRRGGVKGRLLGRQAKGAGRLSVLAEIFIHPLVMGTVFGLLTGLLFEPAEQTISDISPGP